MTSGVHQKWREDGISHHHGCITNLTKVDGISRKFMEPARDLTAARPNYKSRSAPYHTPHGSRRATDRAPDGSLTETDRKIRRTLGVMTPAGVYAEDMPNGRRFKCDLSINRTIMVVSSNKDSPTILPCLYLIKRAWNRPNSSNSCGKHRECYYRRPDNQDICLEYLCYQTTA
ncbi:hypothetical protein Bbelb_231570 [Branchiostoma belcheri]|nr:hypothetical protein Bbelb_231570 [Branchiostoma belcheri]